jgi:hypothetical protein
MAAFRYIVPALAIASGVAGKSREFRDRFMEESVVADDIP